MRRHQPLLISVAAMPGFSPSVAMSRVVRAKSSGERHFGGIGMAGRPIRSHTMPSPRQRSPLPQRQPEHSHRTLSLARARSMARHAVGPGPRRAPGFAARVRRRRTAPGFIRRRALAAPTMSAALRPIARGEALIASDFFLKAGRVSAPPPPPPAGTRLSTSPTASPTATSPTPRGIYPAHDFFCYALIKIVP